VVWILPVDVATQPAALLEMLGRQSAVGLNCIPSFWSVILDEIRLGGARAPAESLTALILGGEQATPDLVTGSFAAIPNLKIWNVYGPTEATGNASAGIATLDDGVPIGRPIANTQLYVLDRRFNPVPVGVPGELYIGGDGLARGYLKRTELTAEAFLPNPFSERPGARLYRTGDRVRWRPDGQLQFLGRLDEQVKIRGFRVEPGEIEAVLAQHPDVRQAAVVARANASGQNLLAAYVVSARSQATTEHRLNRFLRQRLPDYMIPSRFVALDTLPRLPNGKVNRKALPSPPETGLHLPRASAPPRTPVEETLTVIWVEVFGDQVGVHDNFFELGGHSLQGTQLVARIRRRLGVDLPIRVLFESPTIAELGAWLDALEERVGVP
jgi:acyl-coenzyme A synthetase/AMP-(fatty) acid ligase/aryl carrier-like protein